MATLLARMRKLLQVTGAIALVLGSFRAGAIGTSTLHLDQPFVSDLRTLLVPQPADAMATPQKRGVPELYAGAHQ